MVFFWVILICCCIKYNCFFVFFVFYTGRLNSAVNLTLVRKERMIKHLLCVCMWAGGGGVGGVGGTAS